MNTIRVLVTDDDSVMLRLVTEAFPREGLEAIPAQTGREAVRLLQDRQVDIVVTNVRTPDIDGMEILRVAQEIRPGVPVILVTDHYGAPFALDTVKPEVFDCLCKPFALEDLILKVRKAVESTRLRDEKVVPRGRVDRGDQFGTLIGTSKAMADVFSLIKRAAVTDINVLITGESGTGKELVAKAIHENSERQRSRFVPVNCAALPETLIESELLGHVRGAFTGATTSRRGLIEEANGGTLFLDEIGEMPIVLQAKLLRVLEDKAVRPVGSNRAQPMDFRLITATNKDPKNQVAAGALRDDLFFRLNVISIALLPLRERMEDLRPLVLHFIEKHAAAQGSPVRAISREAFALLEAYPWPGNVRELENAIERAIALAQSDTIQPGDLPAFGQDVRTNMVDAGAARAITLRDLQEQYIARILDDTGGDRERAARILGVHPRTLRRRDRRMEKDRDLGHASAPLGG